MKRKIIWLILLLLVAAGGFVGYKLFSPSVKNPKGTHFYIKDSDNVAAVKANLISENYISGSGFDLAAKILRFKKAVPGRYKFKDGLSLYQLIKVLRSGEQPDVKIVIIKERTKELFAGKMGEGKKFDVAVDSLEMINYLNNSDSLKKYGLDTSNVMSVIMPYTYNVKWNSSPDKIFQQFYTAYKKFWTTERKAKADNLHLTPLEVITLASIVEEETNKKADKYNIASTYLNRIETGMKLQADPTVKFAMRNFALKRILGVHLQTVSPYNTYMYAGLPPGPICTPSAETIDAVLDAPATDYLFFVASYKFDGSSIFTSNLNDHVKYARLYQQELTRRMDSASKAKQKPPM